MGGTWWWSIGARRGREILSKQSSVRVCFNAFKFYFSFRKQWKQRKTHFGDFGVNLQSFRENQERDSWSKRSFKYLKCLSSDPGLGLGMATSVSGAERCQDHHDPGSRQMSASTPGTLQMFGSSSYSSLESSSTGRRIVSSCLSCYLFENIPFKLYFTKAIRWEEVFLFNTLIKNLR